MSISVSSAFVSDFLARHTRLVSPPLVPEVRLHLAGEALGIWQMTEDELGRLNLPPPYWAFAWAGGQAVSRFLLDRPERMAGRRVLDLGAGSGLGAIAALRAGAASVLANDVDGLACAVIAENAAANGVEVETTVRDLTGSAPPEGFDVILVGDLFYEKPMSEAVLAFVETASARGADVLVGDPRRSYFPKDRFEPVTEYDVPTSLDLEDAEVKHAAVWRLLPR